ncbi:MAG: ribosome small subunit-dependent GTPase A [Bacteroidales bacterium]|nr:ribosome small subunit-dependent GTPase A [Bacteroidales bacterium]
METGIVVKSVGSRYKVLTGSGSIIVCVLKGNLRVRGLRTTNPVAVGDNVKLIPDKNTTTGVITEILDRRNYILRKASNLSKQSQIIAANIDQAFLMATIKMPETPVEFIDRFLITAEAYSITAKIIFNKTDLYDQNEREMMETMISLYSKIGYECIRFSVKGGGDAEALREKMKNRITLIAGNSGVGKSSLINLLHPGLNIKTEEISSYHKQGKHVTTFPEMYIMPFGGFVIDTPGLRGFGVVDMDRNEIYHFFPEIFRISEECKFYNCLHSDEPGCAVREAVEKGEIAFSRYRSYMSILNDNNLKYR